MWPSNDLREGGNAGRGMNTTTGISELKFNTHSKPEGVRNSRGFSPRIRSADMSSSRHSPRHSVRDLTSYLFVQRHAARVESIKQIRSDGSNTPSSCSSASTAPSTPHTLPATPESSPFRSLCSPELVDELDRTPSTSPQSPGNPRGAASNPSLSPTGPTQEAGEPAGRLRRPQITYSRSLSSLTWSGTQRDSLDSLRSQSGRSVAGGGTQHSPMLRVLQVDDTP